MFRTILVASALIASLGIAGSAQAEEGAPTDRLLIVNGNTGRVVYDDGRDDLFCVTRRYVAGHNQYGRPVIRRTMRCR